MLKSQHKNMLHATKFVCSGRCYTESKENTLNIFRSIGGVDDLKLPVV